MAEKKEKQYVSDNAQLMAEWNWEKNNELGLSPNTLTLGSDKKVWWKCSRAHEWPATIGSRNGGCKCPYCAGLCAIKGENDFQTVNPDIAKEWDFEKNRELKPSDVLPNSSKKVWWKCSKGHSWQTAVSKRTIGQNCPFCSGKKTLKGYNDLSTTNPELISEWDFLKNERPIHSYRPMSNKKVWWICDKGHSWYAAISKRAKGEKCPICQGKQILVGFNDLSTTHPYLAKEWDYKKNEGIAPYEVGKGSHKKVWWICKRNHSWKSEISSRTYGCGCPICASETQTSFPEKAIYYYVKKIFPDAIQNFKSELLNPFELDVYIPSLKLGIEYDGEHWHQHLENDLNKNKKCTELHISLIRIREPKCPPLLDNLSKNIIMKNKKNGISSAIREVIETLSQTTHMRYTSDIDLSRDNAEIISLLEISEKENGLSSLFPNLVLEWDFNKNGSLSPNNFTIGSGKKVWWICSLGHSYFASIVSRTKGRGCPICSGRKVLKGYNDFESCYPELVSEWDYEKNEITPDKVTFGSDLKVSWKCEKGHSYSTTINNKRAGSKCPYCSGKRVLTGYNDIATTHPEILEEWDYEKNEYQPANISAGSHKKAWWKCKICGFEWYAPIYNRTSGHGCSRCAKKRTKS